MPTYVYKFVDTGETIEVQQAFTDPTLTELAHPTDGVVRPVKKVFLPVGITFKGSGFYKTDSRNGQKSSSSSSASTSSSSTGSSGDSAKSTSSGSDSGSGSGSSGSTSASTASSSTSSTSSGGGSSSST